MDAIKIKYQNQICNIICQTCHFNDFLRQLEEKLKHDFFYKDGHFKAFFSFPFQLNAQECMQLYELCELYHTLILGFDNRDEGKPMKLLEHSFFAGETYDLKQDCVYVGDIERDVYVRSSSNLYVIGEIKGQVDLLFPNVELSASSFDQARVRIFDSKFQNVTNIAPCKVYYKDGMIKQS